VLALLSDTLEPKRANVATLAGKSTLNRLERAPQAGDRRYHKSTKRRWKRCSTGKAARLFKELSYRTLDSWSRPRRVVAKGRNPRFIVTSLSTEAIAGQELYEKVYCARGEMENRIKECQLDLFADRTSASSMHAKQLRLWFSALAGVLMEHVRRLALKGTELANATAGSIRLKLLRIGAVVRVSVRRITIALASACPLKDVFTLAHGRLRRAAA